MVITLKRDGICADCGAELKAGTRAKWYKNRKVYGLDCHEKKNGNGTPRPANGTADPIATRIYEAAKTERYISCADTSKLVRIALHKAFPAVKFSVRSSTYSGGASIDVSWTDGPLSNEVKEVAGAYHSSSFDGMIDMAVSHSTWLLPDGSVSYGSSPGTEGSRGTIAPSENPKPSEDAISVHLAADYISFQRSLSPALLARAAEWVASETGLPALVVGKYENYEGENARSTVPWKYFSKDTFHESAGLATDTYQGTEYEQLVLQVARELQ